MSEVSLTETDNYLDTLLQERVGDSWPTSWGEGIFLAYNVLEEERNRA